jgi:hypothetical protein
VTSVGEAFSADADAGVAGFAASSAGFVHAVVPSAMVAPSRRAVFRFRIDEPLWMVRQGVRVDA